MSDTYSLIINFEKEITLQKLIDFLKSESFMVRMRPEQERLDPIERGEGGIIMYNSTVEMLLFYIPKRYELRISLEDNRLIDKDAKQIMQKLVDFIKTAFPVKKMKEVIGYYEEPCPFVLDHE